MHTAPAQIFIARGNKFKRRLRWLSFVGIAGALLIGGVVIGFGVGARYLNLFLALAAITPCLSFHTHPKVLSVESERDRRKIA